MKKKFFMFITLLLSVFLLYSCSTSLSAESSNNFSEEKGIELLIKQFPELCVIFGIGTIESSENTWADAVENINEYGITIKKYYNWGKSYILTPKSNEILKVYLITVHRDNIATIGKFRPSGGLSTWNYYVEVIFDQSYTKITDFYSEYLGT